jgi:hypothetical protein
MRPDTTRPNSMRQTAILAALLCLLLSLLAGNAAGQAHHRDHRRRRGRPAHRRGALRRRRRRQADVDIADVVAADLARSGKFKPMPRREMLMTPHREADVDIREWQLLAMNSLVVGEVSPKPGGGYDIRFELIDVFSGKKLLADTVSSTTKGLRNAAHRIADKIYEELTGEPGVFATRIAYVTSAGSKSRVALRVADADGFNAQTIVDSAEPIMAPAWSPDGASWPMCPSRGASPPSTCRTSPAAAASAWRATRASTARRPFRRTGASWP